MKTNRIAPFSWLGILWSVCFANVCFAQVGSVSGLIADPYGRPVSGVLVHATDAACGSGLQSGVSDSEGRYSVEDIPTNGDGVEVYVFTENASGEYHDAWWDGNMGGRACEEAAAVAVSQGAETSGIDIAIDWMPGALKWKCKVDAKVVDGSPAIGPDGTIYCAAGSVLYAFDSALTDDRPLWTFEIDPGSSKATPVIGPDGTIYVNATGNLYAIFPDGLLRWTFRYETGSSSDAPAIGVDGTIYAAAANSLYAFDPNGSLKWRYSTETSAHWSNPAIDVRDSQEIKIPSY